MTGAKSPYSTNMSMKLFNKIKERLGSQSGRNALTFFVFLCIATLFWFLMSLNDEVQHDYQLSININGMPEDITLLSSHGLAPVVNVSIRDKGVNQLSREYMKQNTLKVDYSDFVNVNNERLTLSEQQLSTNLRQFFGSSASIVSHSPDSLSIAITTLPPLKMPLVISSEITTRPQYVISGKLQPSTDSILVYSAHRLEDYHLPYIPTNTIKLTDLHDTTTVTVKPNLPAGCRSIPEEITVTIPVEPLISKTFNVNIEPINAPDNMTVITFPSTAQFTCLVPMSIFNAPAYPIKAYADYNQRKENIIPLEMSLLPDNYLQGSISPQTVEYILESR